MVSFGFAWIHLDSLGFTRSHLDSLGLTWTLLDSLGLIWIHLDPFGFLWIHYIYCYLHGFSKRTMIFACVFEGSPLKTHANTVCCVFDFLKTHVPVSKNGPQPVRKSSKSFKTHAPVSKYCSPDGAETRRTSNSKPQR